MVLEQINLEEILTGGELERTPKIKELHAKVVEDKLTTGKSIRDAAKQLGISIKGKDFRTYVDKILDGKEIEGKIEKSPLEFAKAMDKALDAFKLDIRYNKDNYSFAQAVRSKTGISTTMASQFEATVDNKANALSVLRASELEVEKLEVSGKGKEKEKESLLALIRIVTDKLKRPKRAKRRKIDTSKVSRIFGQHDLSSVSERVEIYNYWNSIADGAEAKFVEAFSEFKKTFEVENDEEYSEFANKIKSMSPVDLDYLDVQDTYQIKELPDADGSIGMFFDSLFALTDDEPYFRVTEGFTDTETGKVVGPDIEVEEEAPSESRVRINDLKRVISEQIRSEGNRYGSHIEVDPLLAIEMVNNDKIGASFDMSTVENLLANIATLESESDSPSKKKAYAEIKSRLLKMKDFQPVDMSKYHLPIFMVKDLGQSEQGEASKTDEAIEQFLDALTRLAYEYVPQFPAGSLRAQDVKGQTTYSPSGQKTFKVTFKPTPGAKGETRQFSGKSKEVLDDLVNAAYDYFVEPVYSAMYAVASPEYRKSFGFKGLSSLIASDYKEGLISGLYGGRDPRVALNDIKANRLDRVLVFLREMANPSREFNAADINLKAKRAINALDDMFGDSKDNEIVVGKMIVDAFGISRGSIDSRNKMLTMTLGEADSKFKSGKAYSIVMLPYILSENKTFLSRNETIEDATERFLAFVSREHPDLDPLLKRLLDAHDEVRKLKGMEIYKQFRSLEDYEHVSEFIDMMQGRDLDMSANEVSMIVKSYDSHESISKNFGISAEDVYFVKAHFR